MFLFLGLKNDDDDRRDNQYQARGTVEAELLPEMQHPDEYCRQRSIEPRIDVIVEPISLIARTSVRLDTTVGTRASNRRFCQRCHLPGSGAPVVDRAYTRKKQALKSRT